MTSSSTNSSKSSSGSSRSSKSSSSSNSSFTSLSSKSSSLSSSTSTWLQSTSSQTESTSSSSSSISSMSSSTSSEIKATQLEFGFRGTKWSISKLICSGIPAVRNALVQNKQCQIIKIPFDKYTIEYVSCFLGKFNKDNVSYNLTLEVYDTDEDGLPQTLLGSSSVSSDVINTPAWYSFNFGGSLNDKTTPTNQLLALVFYQDGGDETNYINWYYSLDLNWETKAYVSKDDGTIWTEQNNMTRAIIISDIFNIFEDAYIDTDNHRLTFPAGQDAKLYVRGNNYLAGGEFINTQLLENGVEINYKPSVLSIVVDSSGSMGWNDRYQDRIAAIRSLINKLKTQYPGNVSFDIISFGSYKVDTNNLNIFDSLQTYLSAKLDLNNPTSSTLNNDGSIPSLTDGFVSWGLKDLENSHEYIISSVNFLPSNVSVESGLGVLIPETNIYSPVNYQNVGNQSNFIKYSVEKVGPGSEKEIDGVVNKAKNAIVCKVPLNNTNIVRHLFASFRELNTAFIIKNATKGDITIFVDSFEEFDINSIIDIFDTEHIDTGLKIILKETIGGENIITLDRPIEFDFKNSFESNGSLLQESSINDVFHIDANDTMIELIVKDSQSDKAISFCLQSSKGGTLEWEFTPFNEWKAFMLFYAGDTARFDFKLFDSDGNPLPDFTMINLLVDKIIDNSSWESFGTKLTTPIKTGDSSFVLWSNDSETADIYPVEKGDFIILKGMVGDEVVVQGYTVTSVEETEELDPTNPEITVKKKTVTFFPPHMEAWDATNVLVETKEDLGTLSKVDIPISAVDISPTIAGRKLSPEFLEIQDPPQVDPSSGFNDFNQSKERKRDNIINIPLIGGKGRIRILPITEDIIETAEKKKQDAFSFYEDTSLTEKEIIKKQTLEREFVQKTSEKETTSVQVENTETPEYTIETPIYLIKGLASSHMTAKAREMIPIDLSYPYDYKIEFIDDDSTKLLVDKLYSSSNVLAKKHTIYPSISVSTGNQTLNQKMQDFDAYFQSPIQMASCIIGTMKDYCIWTDPETTSCCTIPFIYAVSDSSIKLHYNVFYKGTFLKEGQMRIRIFDANREATDMIDPSKKEIDLNTEAIKYIPKAIVPEHGAAYRGSEMQLSEQINYYHEDINDLYINGIKLQEATYLPGYIDGGYLVNIENGRAVLTISSDTNINFESHLRIFAEIISPNDDKRSTVLTNTIFIKSPLEITPMVDGENFPMIEPMYFWVWAGGDSRVKLKGDGKTVHNFGAKITWLGEIIQDNTLAEFLSTGTKIGPSISKTINGIAQDSYVGPHNPVVDYIITLKMGDEVEMGSKEEFVIKTSFNGIKCSYTINAMWIGELIKEGGGEGLPSLYVSSLIYKNGSFAGDGNYYGEGCDNIVWADGWDYRLILVDLSVSYVGGFEGIKETAPFLLGDFKTGNEQNKPVVVNFGIFGKGIFTKNKPVDPVTNQSLSLLIANTTNIPYGWAVSSPIRKSFKVPDPQRPEDNECQSCWPYTCDKIAITASLPSNTKTYGSMRGCWSTTGRDCRCFDEEGKPTGDWYKPKINWIEPLQGSMSLMSEESPYVYDKIIMDGRNRTRIDVDVSFSGKAIPIIAKKYNVVKFTKNQNTNLFTQSISNISGESSNQSTTAYNDQMYEYYTNQIKNQDSQTTGNLSLIKYKSKATLTWMDYFPNVSFEIFLGFADQNGFTKSRTIPALSLTQNSVLLSIKYTSLNIYVSNEEIEIDEYATIDKHFHECDINEYGNGKTIRTFAENTYEDIENHEHSISNFVVQNMIDNSNIIHTHELKSTVSTYVNPFTIESLGYLRSRTIKGVTTDEIEDPEDIKQLEQIIIVGQTEYDASRDFVERNITFFKVVDIYSETDIPYDKRWSMELLTTQEPITRKISYRTETEVSPVGIVYTQESTTNDYSGFNVDISLKRNDGTFPPDGTRAQIEIESFAAKKAEQSSVDIKSDGLNPYINLKINAKTIIDEQQLESDEDYGKVAVLTKFNLLPIVKPLVPEITSDETYINTALTKIESIGSSQLNDAIVEASSRIKKHYLDNPEQNTSYSIMVFSDGEENYSEHGFNYVIKVLSIGFDTPIYAVGIGNMGIMGKSLLNAYAVKTGGSFLPYGANSAEQIEERIIDIIKNQQTNSGIYTNIIEFPDSFCIKEVTPLVTLPIDSKILISFQVGNYLNNLSLQSDEFQVVENQPINIEEFVQKTKNKYIKYKTIMTGNENFQSPLFLGCLSTYVQPRTCKVFSQPIETNAGINDVMSEITVTHKATSNDLVEIEYGICLLDSTKENNYYNNYILPFKSGERYIVLSRSNETMYSEDNITYQAQNGTWDESLQISVFAASSPTSLYKLINSDEYIVYPIEGKISFIIPRQKNDSIIFSVLFPSQFRILCKVKNHSLEKAYIDHIGLTYGLATKSFEIPVSSYIGLLESSSSSSFFASSSSSSSVE